MRTISIKTLIRIGTHRHSKNSTYFHQAEVIISSSSTTRFLYRFDMETYLDSNDIIKEVRNNHELNGIL
ncbi:Uncharacterized protein TCM_031904 [Theobroma cacao]|uniref:Uncharacterized protein n=1 Tax=Theobroma cacao TaxID=3641 RepID=A0A061F7M4_THECC|nr:Uncharacterized protein TCM_031904 [Theobroma cacao]